MSRQRTHAFRLALLTIFAISPTVSGFADAPPVSSEEYRARIAQVRETVQSRLDDLFQDSDGCSDDAPWSSSRHLTAEERNDLRKSLRAREPVAFEGRTVMVENAAALEALDQQETSSDCLASFAALTKLNSHLTTLDASLSVGRPPLDVAPAEISDILQRDEFRIAKKEDSPFERFRKWLDEKLRSWFGRRSGSPVETESYGKSLTFALIVGLAVAVGALAWVLYRRFRNRQADIPEKVTRVILGEVVDDDATADSLLDGALRLAQAGEHRLAVRKIYIALLYEMDNRGVIRIDPALTNREYLRAVRAQLRLYPAMREMTDRFDEFWYGQRDVRADDYERFLAKYHEAAAALPAAA
jgi:hypothetical protein